jgi:polyhydroxyalkanoate synthase subunit PhaC
MHTLTDPPSLPLPTDLLATDPGSALLAMAGALPVDDGLVLGLSGPAFSPQQSAALVTWRLQQAYTSLLAVAPVWAALRQQPDACQAVLARCQLHPWASLLNRLLPEWCAMAADSTPTLASLLRQWQRLHDQHWQAQSLPVLPGPSMPLGSMPTAPLPVSWQNELQQWAQRAGRLSAQALQASAAIGEHSASCAQPGDRSLHWQAQGARLYRYPAAANARPVLLIYAWINRSDVLDLAPSQSLIAALQAQGLAVWLLDWADTGAHGVSLEQYLFGQLEPALAQVRAAHQQARIALFGICQGGSLALSYAALRPQGIASLSLAVTPIDFHTATDRLSAWARPLPSAPFAALQSYSPAVLNLAFLQLKPYSLRLGKYLSLLMQDSTAETFAGFLRMEHWLMSGPLLSGPALASYLDRYYHQNALCKNALVLAGEPVKLEQLAIPVQLLIAEQDHIVPPAAAQVLAELMPNCVQIERFATGHIGLLVGRARMAMAEKVATFVNHVPN